MGTVYEATQDSPRRPVALKVLPTELARDPKVAERFAREANRLAALEEHPGIAKVYASGEESGVAYLAMQLLTGGDLEARLQSHGRLPWQEAATIGAAVADALHFAHEQGIVHRDVKPANIMFTGQGQPVVTDFGIAQAADEVRMTMTGTSICTPEYASPEQIKGNPLDGRSDLYSLGVVLYRMVCGLPLFDCPSPISWAMKHVSEAPPSPRLACPDLPPAFEAIIMRCLAKEPHERFATGADLARALREVQAAPAATVAAPAPFRPAPPPPAATTVVTAPARARFGWAVVALIVIGALALGAGGMALVGGSRPAAPPDYTHVTTTQTVAAPDTALTTGAPATPSEVAEAGNAAAVTQADSAEPSSEAEGVTTGRQASSVGPTLEGEEGKEIRATGTGLKYLVLNEGSGATPGKGDTIVAEYTGWLTDGTRFDSSKDHPGDFSFTVGTGQVIPGWDEALLDMRVGERRKLIVPPDLGYGGEGMGPIPPNATLVFEVKLLKIK
ncbi:MAG: FKBP-type peptidyl-prolyl cis-trans isomerase [Armatimonadia bacterium]